MKRIVYVALTLCLLVSVASTAAEAAGKTKGRSSSGHRSSSPHKSSPHKSPTTHRSSSKQS